MIVVKFSGGLGNQMYQYAIYSLLKKRYPQTVIKADISFYNLLCEHNGFEIDKVFKLDEKIEFASKREIVSFCSKYIPGELASKMPQRIKMLIAHNLQYKFSKIKGLLNKLKRTRVITGYEINVYNPLIYALNTGLNDYYLDGLWQNIHYYDGNERYVKSLFEFKIEYGDYEQTMLDKIVGSNSVSIHIRRGDFLGTTLDICTRDYYSCAIKIINSMTTNIEWFVFSDDCELAEIVLKQIDIKDAIYVKSDKEHAYYDLMLMSQCKHNIISNSTFSFWASFLNKNEEKIVIAPRFCVKNEIGNYEFSLPDNYIRIEV